MAHKRKTTKKEQEQIDQLKKSLDFKPQFAVCDAFTGEVVGAAQHKQEVSEPPKFQGLNQISDTTVLVEWQFCYDENVKDMREASKGVSIPVLLKRWDLKETFGYAKLSFAFSVEKGAGEYVLGFLTGWSDNMELIKYLSERKARLEP